MNEFKWIKIKLNHLSKDRTEKTYSFFLFNSKHITEIASAGAEENRNKILTIDQLNGSYALNIESAEKLIKYLDIINDCLKHGGLQKIEGEIEVEVY